MRDDRVLGHGLGTPGFSTQAQIFELSHGLQRLLAFAIESLANLAKLDLLPAASN